MSLDLPAILDALPHLAPGELDALREAVAPPPWKARQRRLDSRAAAIRAALAATGEEAAYGRACAVARCLKARSQGRRGSSLHLDTACDQVLALNEGKPLGWRTLLRVADVFVKNSCGDDKHACGSQWE